MEITAGVWFCVVVVVSGGGGGGGGAITVEDEGIVNGCSGGFPPSVGTWAGVVGGFVAAGGGGIAVVVVSALFNSVFLASKANLYKS